MGVNAGEEFVLELEVELEVSNAVVAGMVAETAEITAAAVETGGVVAGGALIGVDTVGSCWTHGRLDEQFTQEPSLLGRQSEQGLPAFTQAHPLQEPVLLHLQHGIIRQPFNQHIYYIY